MKPEHLIPLIAIICIVGYVAYVQWIPRSTPTIPPLVVSEDTQSITLTKDGFVPGELTIPVGTIVTFRTDTGELFWPASNLHPSHLTYAEFDPKEPVPPSKTWSFTFDKAGTWKYHDHLAPYYTGVVVVTE
ncbi:MAG: hypothetical protein AAB440_00740 [Patescibacteria group bacterium]